MQVIENDLSGVEINSNIYHSRLGELRVCGKTIHADYKKISVMIREYPSEINFNGTVFPTDKYPSCFKSLDHLIKYFTEVKNNEINKQGEINEKEN